MIMSEGKGFTLIEVLIGAVLIIVGVGSVGMCVVSMRRFLKEPEDKSRAILLASTKIEEYIAKGYSALRLSSDTSGSDDALNWEVKVNERTTAEGALDIPFEELEAVVSYTADQGSGGIRSLKNVRMTNIVTYPEVHTESIDVTCSDENGCPEVPPDRSEIPTDDPEKDQYQVAKGDLIDGERQNLSLEFNYAVTKDIKAAYTISIRADDEPLGSLESADTIYSTFFWENDDMVDNPSIARTPIISQPTFNNVQIIKGVLPGPHTISVRWVKRTSYEPPPSLNINTGGKMWLIDANLSIIATENTEVD